LKEFGGISDCVIAEPTIKEVKIKDETDYIILGTSAIFKNRKLGEINFLVQ